MKKLLGVLTFSLVVTATVQSGSVFAAVTPTMNAKPTATNAPEDSEDSAVQQIKEKIEDKVEQINKSSKQAVSGILNAFNDDVMDVKDAGEKSIKISIDDTVTKYYLSSATKTQEIKRTDIKKGDNLVVFGPIIENQMSANKVFKQTPIQVVQGEITNVDSEDYFIDVVTHNKDELTINIETSTSQIIMDPKKLTTTKAGFSKYKVGDKVHIAYSQSDEELNAVRVLIIPQEYFSVPTPDPREDADTDLDS